MAELTTVARPYAEAVFRAAVEANATAQYGGTLKSLGLAVSDVQASSMLGNPKVAVQEKASVLTAATAGNLAVPLSNLLTTLLENGKATLLPFISDHFQRLQREHDGVIKATITSAFALSDNEKTNLVDALTKKYGKKIEVDVKVDESLIGGARVQVGDEVVHASVRDTLDKMKHALLA